MIQKSPIKTIQCRECGKAFDCLEYKARIFCSPRCARVGVRMQRQVPEAQRRRAAPDTTPTA